MANRFQLLLAALAADLVTIRTTNGYLTNLGLDVDLERVHVPEGSTRVSLRIDQVQVREISTKHRARNCQVAIEAAMPATQANAEAQAHATLEDLIKRFPALRQYTLEAGAVADVTFDAGRVLPLASGVNAVTTQVLLTALIKETL